MAGSSFKKKQFEDRIMNEINQMFRNKFNDPRLKFVSVTKVELTPDYAFAKVFWDTFDSSKRGDSKKAVESVRSRVRNTLASTLKIRTVPSLSFCYDAQFEAERGVEKILEDEAKLGKKY